MAKKKPVTKAAAKPPTKSQVQAAIAEGTGLTKSQVAAVFDELSALMKKNLGSRGPGQFTIPGIAKAIVKKKPATKARMGTNPFTGEQIATILIE